MFAQTMMDLRVARRAFVRQPLFTAVIVATLALGIGATVTMFGVVDAAVLRPVRFPDADRIVSLVQQGSAVRRRRRSGRRTLSTCASACAALSTSRAFLRAGNSC